MVDDLNAVDPDRNDAPESIPVMVQMVEVCGYLDLEDARLARDQLHRRKIASELVIRTSPDTPAGGDVVEEYWLCADARHIHDAQTLLEDKQPESRQASAAGSFLCSNCKRPVREEETFCANCGMRFSE